MPSIFRNVNIDAVGRITAVDTSGASNDIALMSGVSPLAASPAPYFTNHVQGDLMAEKIWNAVWNDYADLQLLSDELIPGKCYFDTADGAKVCTSRCQKSVIGIASDTFAHAVGTRSDIQQVPIAVAGWALAHVDKEYECGTPLTNDENGDLTEMTLDEKRNYPERIVGIYKRKEVELEFGPNGSKIKVNNRHWVKIK